jgi:hypothetical protein
MMFDTRTYCRRAAFASLLLSLGLGSRPASAAELFFADIFNPDPSFGSIRRVQLDGSNPQPVLDTGGGLRAIALDESAGKIYWVDANIPAAVRRANPDGTQVEDLVTTNIEFPSAIALDVAGGKMYWGDQVRNELRRANLDGSDQQLLRSTAFHRGIAIDATNGKVYWSTSDTFLKGEILRCNLNGTGLETVISSFDAEFKPSAIALDVAGGKVYWTDYVVDVVRRGNLNNTNIQTLFFVGANLNPRGIAVDAAAGKVYWGQDDDFKSPIGSIRRMDLDGAFPEVIFPGAGLVNYIVISSGLICHADGTGDGQVNIDDLLGTINNWGTANANFDVAPPPNGNGVVDIDDLLFVINSWGPCPGTLTR